LGQNIHESIFVSDTETHYLGRFLAMKSRNGWEYCERVNVSGVVVVIALTHDNQAILVEQFRPPVQSMVIEWPAGLVGDEAQARDESIESAALRELEEESGYRATSIERLCRGPSSAGMASEVLHFVRAHGLKRIGPGGGVDNESITVHQVPLAEVRQWLAEKQAAGSLVDPKVFAGLYFLEGLDHKD
jgi:ADP-ribose pyrophosphatase